MECGGWVKRYAPNDPTRFDNSTTIRQLDANRLLQLLPPSAYNDTNR